MDILTGWGKSITMRARILTIFKHTKAIITRRFSSAIILLMATLLGASAGSLLAAAFQQPVMAQSGQITMNSDITVNGDLTVSNQGKLNLVNPVDLPSGSKMNGVPLSTQPDSDTLTTLNCQPGQVPLWTGSKWQCATSAVVVHPWPTAPHTGAINTPNVNLGDTPKVLVDMSTLTANFPIASSGVTNYWQTYAPGAPATPAFEVVCIDTTQDCANLQDWYELHQSGSGAPSDLGIDVLDNFAAVSNSWILTGCVPIAQSIRLNADFTQMFHAYEIECQTVAFSS